MADAFYSLGIPLSVYIVLIFISIGAIGGLFWFVWRNAPPEPVGGPRRRRDVDEEEEDEVPRKAARRRQVGRRQQEDSDEDSEEEEQPQPGARRPIVPRGGARRGLDRMREVNVNNIRRRQPAGGVAQAPEGEEEGDRAPAVVEDAIADGLLKKVGKKKAEKLKAKEEKKFARQAELDARAERKKREEEAWEERKRKEAEKEAERRKEEEEEEKRRIEEEKREEEAYNRMKAQFSVEGEGYSAESEDVKKQKLAEFAAYVKKLKVVPLEELSAHFLLRTNEVVDRLKALEKDGELSGVIDDRGKYIYITHEEMEQVMKFIKRRGRVSVDEIVAESNRLIKFPAATAGPNE